MFPKRLRCVILFLLYNLFPFILLGQYSIAGKVIDSENRTTIENCTIVLKRSNLIISSTITDSLGKFIFENLPQKDYIIQVFRVGFFDTSLIISIPMDNILEIALSKKNVALENIIVKGQKPYFERKGNRFILAIAGNKFYNGTTCWDLLKITPLVVVTEQGGIGISGTSGVRVYLNDKKLQLNGEALVNFLKSVSSDNILRIEVITIPSSKFEAEGGGGIINIVLKKNEEEGLKGNFSISTSQATYTSQSVSGNINYRKKRINLFSNLTQSRDNFLFTNLSNLILSDGQGPYYSNSNNLKRHIHDKLSFSSNSGLDFSLSKRETVSLLLDYSHTSLGRQNETDTRFTQLRNNIVDSLYKTFSSNKEKTSFFTPSLYYEYLFDSSRRKLNVSVDFLKYNELRNSSQNTFLSDNQDNLIIRRDHFLSQLPQKIANKTLSIDYSGPLNNISLETGLKYTNSNTDNNVLFQILKNNQYISDPDRSDHFKYEEVITSAYFNINGKLNAKIDYQGGLRFENTRTKGNSLTTNQTNQNKYTNLFYTFFINYIPNREHQFSFASTSRINRPSFWDINPFRYYISNNIFVSGNPFLLPSRTYKQEITYTYKGKLVVLFAHGLTKNSFALLDYFQGPSEYKKQTNYGTKESTGLNLVYSNRIFKPWFLRVNGEFTFLKFNLKYDTNNISISTSRSQIMILNGFTISEKRKLYLTSILRNSFSRYSENTKIDNQFRTDFYTTKVSKNGKCTFSFVCSDLFRSAKDKYLTAVSTNSFVEQYYYDSRNISISFSYSFGKKTIPSIKEKLGKNQEEKNRIK